jgi:hypothetical protein
MKKIIFLLVALSLVSCTNDERACEAEKKAINEKYDIEIKKAGDDARKTAIINEQRVRELSSACK